MISDADMLSLCLDAFEALDRTAASCRKFLKKDLGVVPGVYTGSGQHLVAAEMAKRLRSHLRLEQ